MSPTPRIHLVLAAATLAAAVTLPTAASASAQVDENAFAPSIKSFSCADGSVVNLVTPRAGFDALTATDAELEANALPARPTGAKALAVWKRFIAMPDDPTPQCGVATDVASPPVHIPAAHTSASVSPDSQVGEYDYANWAGYVVDTASYTDAFGAWTVPSANVDASSATYSSSWVGVGNGGSATSPLVQAGTESDNLQSSHGSYYLWWEVVQGNDPSTEVRINGTINPGDSIYVHAHLSYDDDWLVAYDETNGVGKGTAYGLPTSTTGSIWPSNQAEWIEERTELIPDSNSADDYYPPLAHVTTTFTGATAYGTGSTAQALPALPYETSDMVNCNLAGNNDLIAYPGAINSAGGFTVYWREYGDSSNAEDCWS